MDRYNDSTNGISYPAEGGRVTSRAKLNQLLLFWLNYTETLLFEEQKVNTRVCSAPLNNLYRILCMNVHVSDH